MVAVGGAIGAVLVVGAALAFFVVQRRRHTAQPPVSAAQQTVTVTVTQDLDWKTKSGSTDVIVSERPTLHPQTDPRCVCVAMLLLVG